MVVAIDAFACKRAISQMGNAYSPRTHNRLIPASKKRCEERTKAAGLSNSR